MIEEFSSPSLNNLKDSIEDALTSESPQDILDCIMLTLKRNSQYHRICARHSKEVLDLLYGCLLYTSPSPRDSMTSRMPSSA